MFKSNGNLFNPQTLVIGSALILTAGLAWVYVIRQAAHMQNMPMHGPEMGMMTTAGPTLTGAVAYLLAWGVMMAAMMLPSATPMIALYGTLHKKRSVNGAAAAPVALFTLVYLLAWLAFGIPVYVVGIIVDSAASASPAVSHLLPYALAVILMAAGAYQFSSLKRMCLHACQSPLGFLMGNWQSGYLGALRMGLKHAVYCIGCCWGLMVVLVAAGAMALNWVLLIAALVFAEKLFPHGEWTARMSGTALIIAGLFVLLQPDWAITLYSPGM